MSNRLAAAPATVRVVLHGRLRRKFGAEFNIGAGSASGAVYALTKLVPDFRAELEKGQYRVRRGKFRSGVDLPVSGLGLRVVPGSELHIVPVAAGAKNSGGGKTILGAVLVIASVIMAIPTFGASAIAEAAIVGGAEFGMGVVGGGFGASLIGSFTIGNLALFGGALMLTGITQLLSPQPKAAQTAQATNSFLISGLTNVAYQGGPMPVVYGRMRVGSVVGSLGYSAEDFSPGQSLTQPDPSGSGYEVSAYGGTTLDGGQTESIGTTGQVSDGQGTVTVGADDRSGGESGAGGGGGKGGGGGGGGTEAPNTLRSKAIVRIIDFLSEGPIGGLTDGAKSIYFNDTPLQASDGTYNYKGVTWEIRYGLPDQDPVTGFPASETAVQVGRRVQQSDPVVQTFTSITATAARVTIRLPAMYQRDTSSGNIDAAPELHYKVEVRPSKSGSNGWVGSYKMTADVHIVGGKCMSAYQRSHRFDLPSDNGANTWDVRLTRVTADSADPTNLQNDLYFDLLDIINDHRLIYPDSAYIAVTLDAETFGSNLPARTYEIYGRTIEVPLNYEPSTRTYANSGPGTTGGVWDLVSMHQRPSDNAAFVLLDMLSNTRYGAACPQNYLSSTRADLYNIAQYADGFVQDGFGGQEPRYSVNVVIANQDDAYRLIQMMVSTFRGMSYWGSGQIVVTADMPADPVKLVNQTNVINGDFAYESTSLKTRHNMVRIAYLDRANRYIPAYEQVSDALDIAKRGVVSTDIVAWGCTTRGAAHRLGLWMIYTGQYQDETVSYKAGPYHIDLRPGDIIQLTDPAYVGARMGGRLRRTTVPSGNNYIADSGTPTLIPVAPNTVTVAGPPGALFQAATVFNHGFGNGASTDTGHISVSLPAGTYYVSCYVWIPAAFSGTTVRLSSTSTFTVVEEALALSGLIFGLSPGIGLQLFGSSRPSYDADLTKRDQWQRISHKVVLASQTTVTTRLDVVAGSGQTVYSTAWQIDDTGLTAFVHQVAGVRVAHELHLDKVFETVPGETYKISVVLPDGTLDSAVPVDAFVSAGTTPDFSIAKLNRALALTPSPNAEWIVQSTQVAPRQFQVLALGEESKGIYSVTAVSHNPSKFGYIELGLKLDEPNYSILPALLTAAMPPPTNVTARDYMTGVGVTQVIRVTVSWSAPLDPRIESFQVMATASNFYQIWTVAVSSSFDIDSLPAGGSFTFGVRSIGRDGKTSSWTLTSSALLVDGKVDPPAAPGGLSATGGTRRVQLRWQPVTNRRDILQYEIWRGNSSQNGPGVGATQIGVSGSTTFLDADSAVLVPNSTWFYWVRGIALGTPVVAGAFAGPVSATTTLLITDDLADGIINTAKFAASIKPVLLMTGTSEPGVEDAVSFNTVDNKLYQYRAGVWVELINLGEITGQVNNAQIVGVAASKVTGQLTDAQIADLAAAKISGQLTDAQLAAIAAAKVSGQLTDAQLAAIAATKITGQLTDAQIADLAAAKISGQLTDAQLAAIASTKITGQLTDAQIQAIAAAKVSGQLTDAQLAAIASTKITGQLTDAQIADLAAAKISGQISNAQIAAIAATKITGQITSTQITDNSISTAKLAVGAVTANEIAAGAITAGKIAALSITAAELAAGSITTAKLAANSVTAGEIAAGAITTAKLAAGAVTANEIAAGAITAGKISALSITATELAAGSITTAKIVAGAITAGEIAAGAITTAKLAAGAVTANELAAGSVTAGKIAALSITATELAAGSIITAKIAAGAITAGEIAAGAITTAKLAAGAVTANELAAGSVTAGKIAALSITAAELAAGSITTAKIAAGSITAGEIAANAVTATAISAGSITTAKIAADAVTANEIAANAVTTAEINAGAITTAKIAAGAITASEIAAGAITAGKIAALSITAGEIAANAVTFGKIAAGAVRATEISAAAISATHLAANFILANSAQIGTAVIKSAQIDNLAVGTSEIQTQSITATDTDYMGTATTPTASWVTYASVSLVVPANAKVRIDVRTVTDGVSAVAQGGNNGGGGGGEGDGGGAGV